MPMDASFAPFGQVFTELRPSQASGLLGVTPWAVLSLTTALTELGAVPMQRPTQNPITSYRHLQLRCSCAF